MRTWLLAGCFFSCMAAAGQQKGAHPPAEDIFAGSLPCGVELKAFLGLPPGDASCELSKWRLSLSGDRYSLQLEYGFWVDNRTFRTTAVRTQEGRYHRPGDTTRLVLEATGRPGLHLRQLDANLLHVTGPDGAPLPGNPGYNYVLSRLQRLPAGPVYGRFREGAADTSAVTVFEGRTPCSELLAATGIPPRPACTKLKWRIILHRRAGTGEPDYYETSNTLNGHVLKRGMWRIVATAAGPVYTLEGPYSLHLLRAGAGVLLFVDAEYRLLPGTVDFGYALGKVK